MRNPKPICSCPRSGRTHMAHDENESTSNWTTQQRSSRRPTAAKGKTPTEKRKIPLPRRASPLTTTSLSGARIRVCQSVHFHSKKPKETPKKPLTHRSAFIHHVSYPLPMPKAWLFRLSALTATGQAQRESKTTFKAGRDRAGTPLGGTGAAG